MIGIIGGSGLYIGLEGMSDCERVVHTSEFGDVEMMRGNLDDKEVLFISRHRSTGRLVPPHLIPHRAHVQTFSDMGAETVLATATVGSLEPGTPPGTLMVPDQYIDLTGRACTFFEGGDRGLLHMDMSDPFCPRLRAALLGAAPPAGVDVRDGGVYACLPGPQFETAAEAAMLRSLGGTVAGMTAVPEARLCAELGICYALLNMVVNAAGDTRGPLTHQHTVKMMERNVPRLCRLVTEAVRGLPGAVECDCASAPRPFNG